MLDIQPRFVTLAELLQGRLFRVPQYQRAYSWHDKQRQDLFEDIVNVSNYPDDRPHFMATLVGLRREKRIIGTTTHQVSDIVDGQQRITTLILLLKAIALRATALGGGSDMANEEIRNEIQRLLVKDDEATLLLLQTNHDSSNHFANYLRDDIHALSENADTIADKELLSAMEQCENFVSDWEESGKSLVELVTLLKNRLTFILHEIDDESIVYTVFEVLNSRGLDVSWFDRLKSMLMAILFEKSGNTSEHIHEVHTLWRDIYSCVGLRLGLSTESLRFAATLRLTSRPNRPLGEEDAATTLYNRSKNSVALVLDTTRWLKDVTKTVDAVVENQRWSGVTQIAQVRMVAAALLLREDLTQGEKERILKRWEAVSFRIYGMFSMFANTSRGDYVRLAWSIINERLHPDEILDRLSNIGSIYSIEKAVANLRKKDCYNNWGVELRYFLRRYEEHLSKEAGQRLDDEQWNSIWQNTPAASIEHIRPQSLWPADPRRHYLGNLLLLPPALNSELSDLTPRKKADSYMGKSRLLIAQEVAEIVAESGWTLKTMREREAHLLEWAATEWAD